MTVCMTGILLGEIEKCLALSLSPSLLPPSFLTTEPHDELHPVADLDGPESVHQEGQGENVGSATQQDEDQAPDDQVHSEGRADGEHLHANVQEHHRLCGEYARTITGHGMTQCRTTWIPVNMFIWQTH